MLSRFAKLNLPKKNNRTPGSTLFTNHCSSVAVMQTRKVPCAQGQPTIQVRAMPTASAGVGATSQESETYLPRGSLISEGFFRSWLVMLMGSYESAQNLCHGLEQGHRIFHLAHLLAQVGQVVTRVGVSQGTALGVEDGVEADHFFA